MPVRKITEQQFRTRRKDRRMVWVDAGALVVGLLVLSLSVSGIVVLDPEPEPITWEYSFVEGKVSQKWCFGTTGIREGCVGRSLETRNRPQLEGDANVIPLEPVAAWNATQVVVRLTWTDEIPAEIDPDSTIKYDYDENSTDILRLDVVSPWGETWSGQAANDIELRNGQVEILVNISTAPEGGKMDAFEKAVVQRTLAEQHTVKDHKALGEWSATVTVVRGGDQNGTAPKDACTDLPPEAVGSLPEDVRKECYLDDNQNANEAWVASLPQYRGTYDDPGNKWVLEFIVRTYSASVTF